ncbi:MAG: hypothetical protein MnENMB40S_32020 [Rhizobiaceae bacterium MnEN-MB40S]|nr:MAG: hypothetical protein MnENMB40S_32020 [Rhizobiaceae bacterium MnEN-MB40S]
MPASTVATCRVRDFGFGFPTTIDSLSVIIPHSKFAGSKTCHDYERGNPAFGRMTSARADNNMSHKTEVFWPGKTRTKVFWLSTEAAKFAFRVKS